MPETGIRKACCIQGKIHSGTPAGKEGIVHGRNCYIASPPQGEAKCVIVVLSDVFGWKLTNTRLLADSYAEKAHALVYLPEFQHGRSYEERP